MDLQSRLSALLLLAEEIDISIRREPLDGGGGGLCHLRGQRVLFVDTSADLETQYEKVLEAMADLSEIEERYLPPKIREDIGGLRKNARRAGGLSGPPGETAKPV